MPLLRVPGSRQGRPPPEARPCLPGDEAAVHQFLDSDPVGNVFVAARIEEGGLAPARLGAEVWGHRPRGRLKGLCYVGANMVPVGADPEALTSFADRAVRQGRRCSSLMGEADVVLRLWRMLEPHWGSAREVRPNQPVLVMAAPSTWPAAPEVRPARTDELELVVPAAVHMFTEEVGVSPLATDGGALYRTRIAALIRAGRLLVIVHEGDVVFKADIAAVTRHACQIQGVWVRPDLRGRGLGTAATAAVVNYALARVAPMVTLYVNDYNVAARTSYQRVGFVPVGTFASVLF